MTRAQAANLQHEIAKAKLLADLLVSMHASQDATDERDDVESLLRQRVNAIVALMPADAEVTA